MRADINVPDLPCGHGRSQVRRHGHRAECSECGSFWDMESLSNDIAYDDLYPDSRFHFDPVVGKAKVRTLKRWLDKSGTKTDGLKVCEVGFGGGYCIQYLMEVSSGAYGIEAIEKNIRNAQELGINREHLFYANQLPDRLPERIDIWFFLDSFEHLPEPEKFMDWAISNSSPGARLFTVMPRADGISERLLGRMWPHKLKDHRFHWSRNGITGFFMSKGFGKLEKTFYPLKYVPIKTILGHISAKLGVGKRKTGFLADFTPSNIAFLFNFGEMGMIFRRDDEA